jgi:hypothetical protein
MPARDRKPAVVIIRRLGHSVITSG